MHQEAAILDAKGIVRFNDNEEFASAGKSLLSQGGPRPAAPQSSSGSPTPIITERAFDVFVSFVSHSSVDKPYVEPLVKALEAAGISVWFDKIAMEWGDSLRSEIDRGLAACRYGIVVFSKASEQTKMDGTRAQRSVREGGTRQEGDPPHLAWRHARRIDCV